MTTGPGSQAFESTGQTRCCTFAGLADFLRLNVIDEAAIYLPLRSYYEHAAELVSLCEQHGIVIRFDSQVFKLRIPHSQSSRPGGKLPGLCCGRSGGSGPCVIKRIVDVSVFHGTARHPLLLYFSWLLFSSGSRHRDRSSSARPA